MPGARIRLTAPPPHEDQPIGLPAGSYTHATNVTDSDYLKALLRPLADQSKAPVQDQHRFGCRRRDSPGAHLCRHRVPQHGRLAGPRIQPAFGHPQCVEHLDHLPVPRLRVDHGRRGWLVCGRNPISQSQTEREIDPQAGRRATF
jgi:hypothetical protein